jgi:epsilon-lactone hydrolase
MVGGRVAERLRRGRPAPIPAAMARFLRLWLATFLKVLAARARRGPLRPGWSLMLETTVAYLRADLTELASWPMPEARAALEARPLPRDAIGRVRRTEVAYAALRGEWFRSASAPAPEAGAILYLHGGSYLFGSPRTHADTLARIALATDRPILAPDYRLAPEHRYPAQLEDALAALTGLEALGVRRNRIVVAGDSAGANLALALAIALRDHGAPQPNALVLISPWLDLTSSTDSHRRNLAYDYGTPEQLRAQARVFAGDLALDDPRLSVGTAPAENLAPTFLQVGTAELLLDECRAWVERARAAGVELTVDEPPDMPHAPPFFASVSPQGRAAIDALAAFVRRQLD